MVETTLKFVSKLRKRIPIIKTIFSKRRQGKLQRRVRREKHSAFYKVKRHIETTGSKIHTNPIFSYLIVLKHTTKKHQILGCLLPLSREVDLKKVAPNGMNIGCNLNSRLSAFQLSERFMCFHQAYAVNRTRRRGETKPNRIKG